MPDDKTVVVASKDGGLALYGDVHKPSLKHVHATGAHSPLVHMVCWDESRPCKVEVSGKVELTGSEEHPVQVRMSHHFANTHYQHLKVEPLDHQLKVATKLSEPIHHALQIRTPLELRFCNPWHITSNYVFDFKMGRTQILSITLTGATVCTPQPCPGEKPCPPASTQSKHP
ncbi:MAG: hypothetical protein WB992_22010 [Bryobacteraceae bacterium]